MRYSSDSSATVELLLARGADPSRRDDAGRTPLEQACQARQLADSASPGATAEESKRFDRLIEILSRADLGAGPVTDEDSA